MKNIRELLWFIAAAALLAFCLNYNDIKKHGLKPYFEKSKQYVHDLWYGK